MKISTFLTIAILTVSGIAVIQSGKSALFAYNNLSTVQTLRELVALRGLWFEELTSLSLERSYSQVMLTMEKGTEEQVAKLRQEQRAHSEAQFAKILQTMHTIENFPMRDELAEDTQIALDSIAGNHRIIDNLMTKPLAERDADKAHLAIEEIKAEIVEMRGMTVHIVLPNEITSTQGMLMMRLQETLFDVREYAGRARSMFAIATLHQRSLTEAERVYVDFNIARAREAWRGIEHITETVDLPQDILDGIAITQNQFFGFMNILTQLEREMDVRAAEAGAGGLEKPIGSLPIEYTLSFDRYFQLSGDALSGLSTLINTVSLALDEKWAMRDATQRNTMIFNIAVLLATIAITMTTVWLVSSKITRRIKVKVDELAALTGGALNHSLSQDRRDLEEIKAITSGLENLQTQLQQAEGAKQQLVQADAAQQIVVARLSRGLNALAAGDLSQRINDRFDPKYQELADNFNAAAAALGELVARVIETANSILSGARGINAATTELSQRTETQGATLKNAAAALEQLTRNIVGSQADATELDALASLASEKGVGMGATMAQTVAAMEAIKTSSQQIEQIVGVMEDIAFQTNLLALNAGVEATRAGAEGSGFAVIASEVRGLAERSAQSAQDIKNLIATSGVEVAKGVEYVAEAEAAAGDIGDHIQKISDLISRIANAATEQSAGLVKVNDGVSQLDLVTQTNVAMVEETTAECASLTSIVQDLTQLISRFQIDDHGPSAFGEKQVAA